MIAPDHGGAARWYLRGLTGKKSVDTESPQSQHGSSEMGEPSKKEDL
jgi:hypothetical protein